MISMTEMNPSPPSTTQVPAADVTAPPPDGLSVVFQAYPLKQPEEEINEFLVRVRGSVLRRARRKLVGLIHNRFPWPEFLLGLSTISAGGTLGALASRVPWNSHNALIFYLILPVLTVGAGVSYGLLRHLTPSKGFGSRPGSFRRTPRPG
jgi:hypothetical protein